MKQKINQTQSLSLQTNLSLQNSLKILSLSVQDLITEIKEYAESNPAVEVVENNKSSSLEDYLEKGDYQSNKNSSQDFDSKSYIESISQKQSLKEYLLSQLHLVENLSTQELSLGELILSNIDEQGFLVKELWQIVKDDEQPYLNKVLSILQRLDPIGCCCYNSIHSIFIQANNYEQTPDDVLDFLSFLYNHKKVDQLDGELNIKEVSLELSLDEEEINEILYFISYHFYPYPTVFYNQTINYSNYVIPELELIEGNHVIPLDNVFPQLILNDEFQSYKEEGLNREDNKFINRYINEAKGYFSFLNSRKETILKIAKAIFTFQENFYEEGWSSLKVMTLKNIAEQLNLSESTISRGVKDKYIKTPLGNIELKRFFSQGVGSFSDEMISRVKIKEDIKVILEEHDKISDQKIADILNHRGIIISRRTVNKYRLELKES